MYVRIEVAVRPDYSDSRAQSVMRKIELAHPELRSKVRWARLLDVYWLDIPVLREELIPALSKICQEKVLNWMFTGNLMPSAAGKTGSLEDLMQFSPHRPGKFWGIERRYRAGVADTKGRTLLEAFEIVIGKPLSDARASTGSLLLMEGADLDEDSLAVIAREVFCNEMTETWTLVLEEGVKKNDRFHQERVKFDLPRVNVRSGGSSVEPNHLWGLSPLELSVVHDFFNQPSQREKRTIAGLLEPTDVELEIVSQSWSENSQHKIFQSRIFYHDDHLSEIPEVIDGLFRNTIAAATLETSKPWLLSALKSNAGICALDEDDAFCIQVETHPTPSSLDPYGGTLTGVMSSNRTILGCGMGAKPLFNTDVVCVAAPDYDQPIPDDLLHPRRVLDGIRKGIEDAGHKSGIPTINGALVFDDRYISRPLVYCGTVGLMPRRIAGELCQSKKVLAGDRVCVVGGRIGKDGIHGATFASLALDRSSPSTVVQLGDPFIQKRMTDFLIEARDEGLYRTLTSNGAGGLSASIGEMARLSGGVVIDLADAKVKYPGMRPFELMMSESQERMTVAVPPEHREAFFSLAEKRGVEVSDLGEFTQSGVFEIFNQGKKVAHLDLKFLYEGVPQLQLKASWKTIDLTRLSQPIQQEPKSFTVNGRKFLLDLLARPNISSKEWLLRQFDHEVQGTSVVKPLQSIQPASAAEAETQGPNDAAMIKPKLTSDVGLTVGSGINPKLADVDPYLMSQAAVDEAVRNVLCVGADYGTPDAVFTLAGHFCWPDPVGDGDATKTAGLVRACYGLKKASLALGLPLISGMDSIKSENAVPPTLLITALARTADCKLARTADFKRAGDRIYLVGGLEFGLIGSELQILLGSRGLDTQKLAGMGYLRVGVPSWEMARRTYEWLGRGRGKEQIRMKSLHDVSEGGVLVAVAEGLFARNLGAKIQIPVDRNTWEFAFGEGFHSFVATVAGEDMEEVEADWKKNQVPFQRIGTVISEPELQVQASPLGDDAVSAESGFRLAVSQLRSAWSKEGYWE